MIKKLRQKALHATLKLIAHQINNAATQKSIRKKEVPRIHQTEECH
jgi:hypothetical protein